MKRNTKKLLAFVVSLVLMVLMVATVVNAAPYSYGSGVAGGTMTFYKYLVMPKDATVPSKTFTFAVSVPAATVDGSATSMPVYPGINPDDVTVGTASFPNAIAVENGTATDGITNDTTMKYATANVTVDFSAVSFTEPGVYRYYITETPAAGCAAVEGLVRTLDVNVVNNTGTDAATNPLLISYVMYKGTVTDAQSKETDKDTYIMPKTAVDGDKCNGFVNKYPAQDLYVGKKVTGNQGSKDKYFKFTVTISGIEEGTTMSVDLTNATSTAIAADVNAATTDIPSAGHTNSSSLVADSTGSVSADYWLQNDQYIKIMGIPKDATYTVVEADTYSAEGYVKTATSASDTFEIGGITFDDETSGTVAEGTDIQTGFTNTKQGNIPTGVILSVAPWVIAGIVVIGGIVFFAIRSRKKYEEQ